MRKKGTKEPLCEDSAGKDCGLKRVIPILLELKKWGEDNL